MTAMRPDIRSRPDRFTGGATAVLLGVVMLLVLPACAPRIQEPSRSGSTTAKVRAAAPGRIRTRGPVGAGINVMFTVSDTGAGRAIARYKPPLRVTRAKPGWNRIAAFVVEQGVQQGVWVYDMKFFGRITPATIISENLERSYSSGKFHTVTRTVGEILKSDPKWAGPPANEPLKVEFVRDKNNAVVVHRISTLNPVRMTTTLPDAGPGYDPRTATDPVIKAVAGMGSRASIVGYVADWISGSAPGGGRSILELVVAKDGGTYRSGLHWRPSAAFGGKPEKRARPESPVEAAAQQRALAIAGRTASSGYAQYAGATPQVFSYVVRVDGFDGTTEDVLVAPDGTAMQPDGTELAVVPWRAPKK